MSDDANPNWITPREPTYVLCRADTDANRENFGLLWGRGSWKLAGLEAEHWGIARVPAYYNVRKGNEHTVGFRDHEIVYTAPLRRNLYWKLIALGADPTTFLEFQMAGDSAIARTGTYGTSVVGHRGIALAGISGESHAGQDGIAVVGDDGFAQAEDGGIAVAEGDDGCCIAIAGESGIALGLGKSGMKDITAGNGGIAIRRGVGGRCKAGERGIVIGDEAAGGANSIVIGETVSGGDGSLLIARHIVFETGASEIATGVVGQNDIEPHVKYIARNGVLELASRE
jgi:hypothetical protein